MFGVVLYCLLDGLGGRVWCLGLVLGLVFGGVVLECELLIFLGCGVPFLAVLGGGCSPPRAQHKCLMMLRPWGWGVIGCCCVVSLFFVLGCLEWFIS